MSERSDDAAVPEPGETVARTGSSGAVTSGSGSGSGPPSEAEVAPTVRMAGVSPAAARGEAVSDAPDHRPRTVDLPLVLGHYELTACIGRGGMGAVFRARDVRDDAACAVKLLIAGEDASEETLQRFIAEGRTASRLRHHPGIVRTLDVGYEGARYYIVMELVEGTTLRELIDRGSLDARRAAAMLADVADTLAWAHAQDVVHRDVKPENILVGADGRPRLSDFGVAKAGAGEGAGTRTGDVLGSISYMAPEQAADSKSVDHRADVYGLGAVLYDALTGRPPHDGTAVNALASLLTADPERPRAIAPEVSPALEAICLKALARDPARRHQTARELGDALRVFAEAPELAGRVGFDERPDATSATTLRLAGAALALLAFAALVALALTGRTDDPSWLRPELAARERPEHAGEVSAAIEALSDRARWNEAGDHIQMLAITRVAERLGPGFRLVAIESHAVKELRHRIATFQHERSGVELNLIPGGVYTMGVAAEDLAAEMAYCQQVHVPAEHGGPWTQQMSRIESPAREVRVAPLLIGRALVRQSEWDRIGGEVGPARDAWSGNGPQYPIFDISWNDATAWVARAGDELRLPTEAEWEWACRAGSTTRFFWGDAAHDRYVWHHDNSHGMPHTASEHERAANAFGLIDMSGNLYEPCSDRFLPYDATPAQKRDAAVAEDAKRVFRGGSWKCSVACCRSAYRAGGGVDPWARDEIHGLRVARSLPDLR